MRGLAHQPAHHENERHVFHAYIEDLGSKNQENAGNQTSKYRGKLLFWIALSGSFLRKDAVSWN